MQARLRLFSDLSGRPPSEQSWAEGFWAFLVSPESVGQLTLTIVGAGIAFAGALWLVRRQLDHDRDLFRSQLMAEREFRRAEMRRTAAYRLGESLVAAADVWDGMSNDEAHEILLDNSFHSRHHRTPGARLAYEAHGIAQRELDLDQAVVSLWRAKLWWWEAVQRRVDDPRVTAFSLADQKSLLFALADEEMVVFDGALRDLGIKLMRWDGEGEIPTLTTAQLPKLPSDHFRALSDATLTKVIEDRARREAERRARKESAAQADGR